MIGGVIKQYQLLTQQLTFSNERQKSYLWLREEPLSSKLITSVLWFYIIKNNANFLVLCGPKKFIYIQRRFWKGATHAGGSLLVVGMWLGLFFSCAFIGSVINVFCPMAFCE